MKITQTFIIALGTCLLLMGCAPKADFDIRGTWEYTKIAANGSTYDVGTIAFSGEPTQGTYLQANIYQVEYDGEYTVSGSDLKLTGYENWNGAFVDANAIGGSWSDGDATGTFTATRQ
jgi:hypothetical protein